MKDLLNNQLESEYSNKTDLQYRRSLGQFFTPFKIAEFMSEWILHNNKQKLRILDPAAGFGVFERALHHVNEKFVKNMEFELWEIDPRISKKLSEVAATFNLNATINAQDFLSSSWEEKYDGIIANPPYYKHHFIKNKNEVYHKICLKTFFKFSIQTNIYCWFLIKSINLLNIGGRLAFIVPSEFFNANYGEKVKQYLKQSGIVLHLININFAENVFDNALTTSVIILAEKLREKHKKIDFYNVFDINELSNLNNFIQQHPKVSISVDQLDSTIKWRNYFGGFRKEREEKQLVPLTKFGHFSRGIASGANQYFTLSEKDKKKHNLSDTCLIPCVTKAIYVKDICFTEKDLLHLSKENKKIYLFDGQKSDDESCKRYIRMGEKIGIHKRYLTRNREPWYALEKRNISKIWVTVFRRNGLKFIWNKTKCLNLTCFHAFYPAKLGEKYLDIFFLYLNTNFAKKLFEREKREYGNGLEKFEPNDINKSLVFDFDLLNASQLEILSDGQKKFLIASTDERKKIIEQADHIFKKASQSG